MYQHEKLEDLQTGDFILKIFAIRDDRPVAHGEFFRDSWQLYRLKTNIELILDRRHSFFAHKSMVYAGFLGKITFGYKRKLVQNMMTLAAANAIQEFEYKNRRKMKLTPSIVGGQSNIKQIGCEFWEEIYYPCGGAATFMSSTSFGEMNDQLASVRKPIRAVVDIMRVMHFVALHNSSGKSRRPSTIGAISSLTKTHVETPSVPDGGRRALHGYWSKHKKYAAFLYAMSDVMIDGVDCSFLEWLISGDFEHHYAELEEPMITVLQKAAYLDSTVFKLRANEEGSAKLGELVAGIEPLALSHPTFEPEILGFIESNHRLFLPTAQRS